VRVHEATGAILTRPDDAWVWVEGAALTTFEPDAVMGFVRGKTCEGWVAVTPRVEPSPRPAALRALAERRAVATWDVHVDEDALYASHTARRWEIQRRDGDSVVSERASFLVEGPRLYALHARARDTDYGRRRRCLDTVTAAFDVMPWEPPVEDADVGAPAEPDGGEGGGDSQQTGGSDAAAPVPTDATPAGDVAP